MFHMKWVIFQLRDIMEPWHSRKEYTKIGQETGEGRRERPQPGHKMIIVNTVARRRLERITGRETIREPLLGQERLHDNQLRKK